MASGKELRADGIRSGNTPILTEPKVCGYFSINGEMEYLPDASQLKYLIPPPKNSGLNYDLKKGYENVVKKSVDPDDIKIDNMLKWILLNTEKIRGKSSDSDRWLDPEFVCFRGRLMMLLCTPYEKNEGWIISASKWRGTIYLCAFDTEEKKHEKNNRTERLLEILSWGFKFEQYLLSEAPDKAPDPSEPVNEIEEFCCMFQSRLGDNKLLYGAEMDGVKSKELLKEPINFDDVQFVELKTNQIKNNNYAETMFRKNKLLKWWSQSYLVGIKEVLCGFRTYNGVVKNLEYFKVKDMPYKSKNFWDKRRCLNFCDDFLNFVKDNVKNDYDKTVYKFNWQPGQNVKVEEVDPSSEYAVLPEWFINQAESYKPSELKG